jgi:DNA-binding SARP family transcriptional activator
MIWPELDESTGLHALQTCVHRLRQRLADPSAVENTAQGYRLRGDTVVDIFTIENFMRSLPANKTLDKFTTLRLCALSKRLDSARPAYISRWDWFAPINRRIEELWRAAKYRLAENALFSSEYARAIALSEELRMRDELDESAWQIAIRALVGSGNRIEAHRELRRYREIMLRELGAEPSNELYDMLDVGVRTHLHLSR